LTAEQFLRKVTDFIILKTFILFTNLGDYMTNYQD